MRLIPFIIIGFLLLCQPALCRKAYAAEFVVTVPDELISSGANWEHFSQAIEDERARLFIEKVVLAPQYKWIRDFVITGYTWGRIRDWEKAEITIQVHK